MNKKVIFVILAVLTIGMLAYRAKKYIEDKVNNMIASGELIDKYYTNVIQDKIWVHRVNSIERLKETSPLYSGVEVDILYIPEKNNFDVSHPPAGSTGITLFDYLKSNPDTSTKFWLDFKNLDSTNFSDALKRLTYICQDLALSKDKFIVESNQTKELQAFTDSGFFTSYYLHYPGLYTLSEEDLQIELDKIRKGMQYETTYISAPFHDYEILRKYFPDKEKLLWMAESKLKFRDNMQQSLYALKVASDPKVKVILYWVEMDTPIL